MKWKTEILSPTSYLPNANTEWTAAENKMFENALAIHDMDGPDRWHKVATMIPGKTVSDVIRQYEELEVDVTNIEAGLIPIPAGCYTTKPFTLDYQVAYDGNKRCLTARPTDHERKKGVPWTEEEHKLFLIGLKKYGKGDWRNISRNIVMTRTPTQVASHAQKYFIRQQVPARGKDKRRSSIHDMTTVNLNNDTMPDSKRPPNVPPHQPSIVFPRTINQLDSATQRNFQWYEPHCGSRNMYMSSSGYGVNSCEFKWEGQNHILAQPHLTAFPMQSTHGLPH
ncbi:hypothetical protein ACFE04_012352 [Oxalis oulophora]